MRDFYEVFGSVPTVTASAPGRVNMLGEHTDYNNGYVLPTTIPQRTSVGMARSGDGWHHFYSVQLDQLTTHAPQAPLLAGSFTSYLAGCIALLEREGHVVPALLIYVDSTVPMGAGLSSSAALEVATLRALRDLLNIDLNDVRIAQLAQSAEIEYAGVSCGIMDQMASSLADSEHMLFLDTWTLERRLVPFPADAEVLVLDSGVARTLAGSGYNQRRAECEEAAKRLGVRTLREATSRNAIEALPHPFNLRARHVVTENARVLEAVRTGTAARFGALMNASHASLRDDYQVSVPPLDALVALLQERDEVYGARLTGAGFGGACVALVPAGEAGRAGQEVLERFNRSGQHGTLLVPQA